MRPHWNPDDDDLPELDESLNGEGDDIDPRLSNLPRLEALMQPAAWADDARSPCYSHIGKGSSAVPFSFTAAQLEALCQANRLSPQGERVLFGLRGCSLVGPQWTMPGATLGLVEVAPDHGRFRCVLGVWDRGRGTVGAVAGSTVPNFNYMRLYVDGKEMSNMLPTGMYRYRVGTHFGTVTQVPSVFRLDQKVMVLRSTDDLCYSHGDFWSGPGNPNDNIHPGLIKRREALPHFSSAGCQTAWGSYDADSRRHKGYFAQLRELAGLSNPVEAAEDGRPFHYILLTGREARISATGGVSSVRRLRIGSTGEEVLKLQQALQIEADGDFGPGTMKRLIAWQESNGLPVSGIVGPAEASALGIALA